jgi:hypothetical protein
MRHTVAVSAYPGLVAPQEIALPVSLGEYGELWRDLEAMRTSGRKQEWAANMRLWSAADHYFLLRFVLMAGRDAWSKHRNEPHFQHEAHLGLARRIQFGDPDNAVLIGARTFGKSTHLIADDVRHKLNDQNDASTWFSLTGKLSEKKIAAIQRELEENQLLIGLWPDRFWRNAEERPSSVKWSQRDGLSIKRTTTRPEQSFEAHPFERSLPTGTHPDGRYYDDIEGDASDDLDDRWVSSQRLHSDNPRRRVTGTYYRTNGMMVKLGMSTDRGGYGLATWLYPGEDLSRPEPNRDLAGPLGGTPANSFSREALWAELALTGGARRDEETGEWRMTGNKLARRDYSKQIACDPTAADTGKLNWSLIKRYSPIELARWRRYSTAMICADPSRGIEDPTVIWVWLLTPERHFLWVDGEMKMLAPRARMALVFQVCAKWQAIAQQTQLRIENFGASEAYERQVEHHEAEGFVIETINCHDTRKSKIARAYDRWQPPAADGRVYFPEEMRREDENGNMIDLVAYFKEREWDPFPQPHTDNMLDAGGLAWEAEERVGPLPWPAPRREKRLAPDSEAAGFAGAGVL